MHGIKIDHYASLTMDAVPILNDLVGGVEVEVLDDFSGIDDRLVKGEKVTLMGDLALKYVRSRSGLEDSSNSSRMKRQQQYVNALYEKIKSSLEADADFALDAATAVSEYMVSDRSVTQMQTLADKFEEYEFMGIKSLKGESVHSGEYIEFHPDADALKGLVVDLFYDPKEK
jgi:anionic cell wall polymer biosynthesis LytR-Cps2A-Psr (LCP) family protein